MDRVTRFSVSMEPELLEKFDSLAAQLGYDNRSEAVRDLIRDRLVRDQWQESRGEVAGTVSLLYDHHELDLPQRLTDIQHDHHEAILSTVHVHLDHHNCLEVLLLKGPVYSVRGLAERLIATKGVKHGTFSMTSTGDSL